MSLKSVEMQIALPRTHEAGKLQEQLQQRGQVSNHHAAAELEREAEKNRSTVIKQEQKERPQLNSGNSSSGQQNGKQKSKKQENSSLDESGKEKHPYKGTIIDFSG